MVGLGYVQYFATMFAQPYYFWQYWAVMVSSLYYGLPLGNVLAYSNSWFSYSGGSQALRMFGILPDTHAFGVMCIFLIGYLAPHLNIDATIEKFNLKKLGQSLKQHKWYLLAIIFFASFGVVANGTRGVWVAMIAPFVLVALIYWRGLLKPFLKSLLLIYAVIILLFIASPFISKGLNLIRTYDENDNFLGRAGSIYDLSESSNAGRIEIWKNSVKFAAVHPFGVGYGNFIVSIIPDIPDKTTYAELSSEKNLRYNLPQRFITAHSLYLQLLVELGFAGFLVFILFWWEYFEQLINFLKTHQNALGHYPKLTFSLALAFIWILAYGVFDVTILNDRVLQYLFISLAISGLIFTRYDSFQNNNAIIEKN
jgi:O-antigen ligase